MIRFGGFRAKFAALWAKSETWLRPSAKATAPHTLLELDTTSNETALSPAAKTPVPRTLWELDATSGKITLCKVCQNFTKSRLSINSLKTSSSQLAISAERGCIMCKILQTAIQAFSTNLMEQEERERDQSLLLNFSLNHSIEISSRESATIISIEIEDLWRGNHTWPIEIYALTHDTRISSFFGISRNIPEKLHLSYCLEFLRDQIEKCDNGHPLCIAQENQLLPRRVLDVRNDSVRLVDTSFGRISGQYITLSYCWGPQYVLLKTTKDTLQAKMEMIEWSALPLTFQDAISITRELGISYIWIDCLCIVQDNIHDWETEAPKMAQYYSQGFLNIAATSGDNPSHGLFGDRKNRLNPEQPTLSTSEPVEIRVNHRDKITSLFVRFRFIDARSEFRPCGYDPEENAPLMERAWVFQERILSRRTLHLHGREMVYECQSTLACECHVQDRDLDPVSDAHTSLMGLKSRLPPLNKGHEALYSMLDYWLDIVSSYSSKKLSYESDRLPALSGLAIRLSEQFGTSYLAGLWEEDLPRQLLWRSLGSIQDLKRPEKAHAPSWSWASLVESSVRYDWVNGGSLSFDPNLEVKIMEAQCFPSGGNSFGAVDSGYITIRARMIQVDIGFHSFVNLPPTPFLKFGDLIEGYQRLEMIYSDSDLDLDLNLSLDKDGRPKYDGELLENRKILCLLMGSGLAWRMSGQRTFELDVALIVISKGSTGNFARMGLFRISKPKSWFKDALMRTITLI